MNRVEKEQLVIKLYEQGKTIREIAKEVHMSFSNIGFIIRRAMGEGDRAQSKDSQAFRLFLKGKKPIDVAILLDLDAEEIERLCVNFWELKELHELVSLYEEIKNYVPSFLKLFRTMKQNKILNEKEIVNTVVYANELTSLKYKVERLAKDVVDLEFRKNNSRAVVSALEHQERNLQYSMNRLHSDLEKKKKMISNSNKEFVRLERLIDNLRKTDGYYRIEKISREQVNKILIDKKAILLAAVIAIIEVLKNNPDKVYDLVLPSEYSDQGLYQSRLLDMAERFYDRLLNTCLSSVGV